MLVGLGVFVTVAEIQIEEMPQLERIKKKKKEKKRQLILKKRKLSESNVKARCTVCGLRLRQCWKIVN